MHANPLYSNLFLKLLNSHPSSLPHAKKIPLHTAQSSGTIPPMPTEQSYKSHGAYDPIFHFVCQPIFLANIILAISITVRDWPNHSRSHLWWIVVSIGLFLLAIKVRLFALAIQDRVIRMEERHRIAHLCPTITHDRIHTLSTQQLIALRFASDAELPSLTDRTLAENLDPKQIKQHIILWRPDNARI